VDIVVSAQGKALPSGEIKIVQPLEMGVIKDILVQEGQEVKKGQTLMILDPSINITILKAKYKENDILTLEINRLKAYLDEKPFYSDNNIQKSLYQSANNRRANLRELYYKTKKEEENLKKILDIVSHNEYNQLKDKRLQYLEQLISNKNNYLSELTEKQNQQIQLNSDIKSIEYKNKKQLIISPVDGNVGKLLIHTQGGIVSPAQNLISIIPKDAPLVFKVNVQNQDIGFIKEDMNVSVKIATFNFQKYGLIDATVTHISDDAIEDEKLGLIYEVLIKPKKYHLEYANKKYKINSGMSVTAEVKIGKRRVINFFIYPLIRYMDEGMSVR